MKGPVFYMKGPVFYMKRKNSGRELKNTGGEQEMSDQRKVTQRLLDGSRDLWDAYLEHPFVQGIADGTLDREKFRFYMIQDYLYLIVNSDYGFTLQPALIMASIAYEDDDTTVAAKIKEVSKYLTKILSWRIWNHWLTSQNQMESKVYELCKQIRNMPFSKLKKHLCSYKMDDNTLSGTSPHLNQQNKPKIKVLLSLITEIVAKGSGTSDYMLNKKEIEVEHIWSNHFEKHTDEFDNESDFQTARNSIGDLLVLPKSFNASYGDADYDVKVKQYFSQNILAQTLNQQKYVSNPGFLQFKDSTGLPFKAYNDFKRAAINERTDLYRAILEYEFGEYKG